MKKRYYLIDTENVGDRWLDLPEKAGRKDRIISFYTEFHSNHLEKYLARQIHNPKILWLECAAGNNALDYQLMGVLSYLIAKNPKASYYICSNDKDYQSTVDFWKSRGIDICTKGYALTQKKKKEKKKKKQDTAASTEKLKPGTKLTKEQYIERIAKSVPTSDLSRWYCAASAILGQQDGRAWYLEFKKDAALREKLSKKYNGDAKTRGVNLLALAFHAKGLDAGAAQEAYQIVQAHDREDLKGIRADFYAAFQKETQKEYFLAVRPLVKVIIEK